MNRLGDNDGMPRSVTPTDRAIIRLLQQNSRASYAELSRKTGIPESTIRRRMERLQEVGVIEFSMVADPAKLGYQLRAIIGIKLDVRELERIAKLLSDMEEVAFAAFVTGQADVDSEWDSYMTELNNINLQDYLGIYQAGYDAKYAK